MMSTVPINKTLFEESNHTMKKVLLSVFALAMMIYFAPATAHAQEVYLGQAHVDGQHDHDNIEVGKAAGRYHFLKIRVEHAPIEFDRIVVHYGNGQAETLQVREVIRNGGSSRDIPLAGDRMVQSLELWYGKAHPLSRRPEVKLFGLR
jgi:hypothetical protein